MIHPGNEPGIRGSYSFVPVGATGKDIDELAKPEGAEMSLAFAGEHTHRTTLGLGSLKKKGPDNPTCEAFMYLRLM